MATQLDNMVIDDQMTPRWIAVEHYRLHTVEEWPDGPYKEATLAAIHSALAGLLGAAPTRSSECTICWKRRNAPVVIKFPSQSNLAA
jgi:hypothetical protein